MSNILENIQAPIAEEMTLFKEMFHGSLSRPDGLLGEVLSHILKRGGKRMRPILTLLIARSLMSENAERNAITKALHAACSLELLHTASLVHDDVVDESDQRRGQKSVNASYTNRIAILVGDYILSTSLNETALTNDPVMTKVLSELGQTLSEGEVIQIQNISNMDFSIERYYDIISRKTAALFEACCHLGGLSVKASDEAIGKARLFGRNLGIIFQIRDDIFDYYDSKEIGKPTGNDMREGKLTLPVLLVVNEIMAKPVKTAEEEEMIALAKNVKLLKASDEDIIRLIDYTKRNNGIDNAQNVMTELYENTKTLIDEITSDDKLRDALTAYLNYVIGRTF